MKTVILSADGDRMAYSVPDIVAEHLDDYCIEFCARWIWTSPHAKKYRVRGVVCYDESDFIAYLNRWLFPNEPSELIENLGWIDFDKPLPEKYRDCPQFNF